MYHGRVVPTAKSITYLRQTVIRQFLRERHGELSWARNRATAALRQQVGDPHFVVFRHGLLNVVDGDEFVL